MDSEDYVTITDNQRIGYLVVLYFFDNYACYDEQSLIFLLDKYKFSKLIVENAKKLATNFYNDYGIVMRYLFHQLAYSQTPEKILSIFELEDKHTISEILNFYKKEDIDKCPKCGAKNNHISSIGNHRVMMQCNSCGDRFMSRVFTIDEWKIRAKQLYLKGNTHKQVGQILGIPHRVCSYWGKIDNYSRPITYHQRKGRKVKTPKQPQFALKGQVR